MAEIRFADGIIRKLWTSDKRAFEAHLLRLEPESRRLRFGHTVSDRFIAEYAERVFKLGGITYGYIENGEIRAVSEVRSLLDRWDTDAEAAFSVESGWRNKGIASELMGRVIRAARNRGVSHLYVTCLAENAVMQRIARKHEAALKFEAGDVVGDIIPQNPTYLSWFEEAYEDSQSFMVTIMDLRLRKSEAA